MLNLYDILIAFDTMTLHELFAHRIPLLLSPLLEITLLGGTLAVFCVGGTIALILALNHRVAETFGLCTALGGAAFVSSYLKIFIARPRPSMIFQAYQETGYSFPSQHTTLSTALSLFLIHLVFRLTPSRLWRTVILFAGFLIPVSVGFSRLYLGVHYLSDVIGGMLLGTIFAILGVMVENSLEHLNQDAKKQIDTQ